MKILISERQLRILSEQPDSKMPYQIEKFGYNPKNPKTLKPALKKQSKTLKNWFEDKYKDPNSYLKFDGNQLLWINSSGIVKSWDAESGRTFWNTPISMWKNLIYSRYIKNKNEWAKEKDAGPIPPGKYIVGPLQEREGSDTDLTIFNKIKSLWQFISGTELNPNDKTFNADTALSQIGWGNFRAPIKPIQGTNTYGRSSFYVHGGTFSGSLGCIDLTSNMDDFAKKLGIWSAENNKKVINLIVDYGSANISVSDIWNKLAK